MTPFRYHLVWACLYGAQVFWWSMLSLLLIHYLGVLGWFPLFFAVICLMAVFEHLARMTGENHESR